MRFVAIAVLVSSVSASLSAGPLDPPAGPVAPTLKTLDEVEPRTPVNRLPASGTSMHTIVEPGSYYLTGNVNPGPGQSAISILADRVTLDLNGFSLDGNGADTHAVVIEAGVRGTVIRNGFVRGFNGIAINGEESDETTVESLTIFDSNQEAIFLSDRGVVRNCTVVDAPTGIFVQSQGIVTGCVVSATRGIVAGANALVQDCTVNPAGGVGISVGENGRIEGCSVGAGATNGIEGGDNSVIRNCTVQGATLTGVSAGLHCLIEGVVSRDNAEHGFFIMNYTTIKGCTARNNGHFGIFTVSSCRVIDNVVYYNSTAGTYGGIKLSTVYSVCDGNQVSNSRIGIDVDSPSNTIVRNICYQNSIANYDIGAGNRVGAIQTNPVTAGPWDNISY